MTMRQLLAIVVAVLVIGRVLQMRRRPDSPGDGFAALILLALATLGAWIALFPGAEGCTAALDGVPIGDATRTNCRVPFGIGALITAALALYAGVRWKRRRVLADPQSH